MKEKRIYKSNSSNMFILCIEYTQGKSKHRVLQHQVQRVTYEKESSKKQECRHTSILNLLFHFSQIQIKVSLRMETGKHRQPKKSMQGILEGKKTKVPQVSPFREEARGLKILQQDQTTTAKSLVGMTECQQGVPFCSPPQCIHALS